MPPKPKPNSSTLEFPTHTFPTAEAFTTFLSTNSTTLPGIYLKLAKKTSGIPSLTASEAVECALCYGWIDGRANPVDSNYWTVRYTPRRKKSIWSKKNVESVGRLVREGRMREEGLKVVDEAKGDGRWERAYGGSKDMEVPEDLEEILEKEEGVRRVWEGLGKGEKYHFLLRLAVVSEKGREKCLRGVVEKLRQGDTDVVEKDEKKVVVRKKATAVKGEKPAGVVKKTVVKKTTVVKKSMETEIVKTASLQQDGILSRREGLRRRP